VRNTLKEWLGVAVTLAGLAGIPVWVVAYDHAQDPDDRRVIRLTGVMKDGAWTTATVTSTNYGLKTFQPAEIKLAVGERVLFHLSSADVTHGFYVPELGIGPVEVEPGHVEKLLFDADTVGTFTYYCTTVCGQCHHFMRGLIHIGMPDDPDDGEMLALSDICVHHSTPVESADSFNERGKSLYREKGCVACHGESGRGGIHNTNYIKDSVPDLNGLADRMYLYDPEDAELVIGLLEDGTDLSTLLDDPPFRRYNRFLAQYQSVSDVIRNGKPAGLKDTTWVSPPMHMPSWEAELSERDIDALIAYLIAEYPWEEDL
jgi:plastocyanin